MKPGPRVPTLCMLFSGSRARFVVYMPKIQGEFRKHHMWLRNCPSPQTVRTVDEAQFRFLVELEVAKAQRLQYCVSVLCLAVDPRAAAVDGSDLSQQTERFVAGTRSTDVVVARSPSSWSLLLVNAPAGALPSIVERITEPLGSLPWTAGAASYPETASGAEDLVHRAFGL